ncbi:MAG: carboxypeptidase-like regulatory domain-containing protein [Saprospiraceae bacterium]|nr:carboxypeptidase-like regulatory domain-containing protein [Saprospiraceae bacterium]
MLTKTFALFLLLTLPLCLFAQVRGVVTTPTGETLPFASIYIQGTTNGTTTNSNGEYSLALPKGTHQLVFQYIGYKQQVETVVVKDKPVTLNVQMLEESIELAGVEVRANAEDPAYPKIRKAIAKRDFYQKQVEEFTCEVYIKGNMKVLESPKKLLGQDVGDLDGNLDTTGQGIVYLSESVSKLYFRQPDQQKEVMESSKVSGNNQGFSFNSAQDFNINLYKNYSVFGRNMVSPIADNALNHYKYRLEGTFNDEAGRQINKIAVLPKNFADPVYRGFIYIVEDDWNIQSADLFTTGLSAQVPMIDTFYVKQNFVPIGKTSEPTWRMFSQTISITGGFLGFKYGGSFTAIYRNYDLNPKLAKDFFDNEVMKVNEGANEKDSSYWNQTRPVPLTSEEVVDYVKKDSLQIIRESKPYMDSIDHKENKPQWGDLLFGYTWQNSWKRKSFTVATPINSVQYNLVQGLKLNVGLSYRKYFDKNRTKMLETGGRVNYGLAEQKLRAAGDFTWRFNPKTFAQFRFSGGQEVMQFNELEPISTLYNTIFTAFYRRNYARFYDKKYVKMDYQQEVANGILAFGVAQFADRSPLENNTDYSVFYKDKRDFKPNTPINDHLPDAALQRSQSLVVGLSLRFRPGQKFMNYPDRKFILGSDFPDLWLHYRKGISALGSDVDYDRLSVAISKNDITIGKYGVMRFRFEAGSFVNNKRLYFQDYRHFMGNETRLGNKDYYLFAFKMLPYYAHSTAKSWLEGHWEHDFKGLLTDRIPGLKKLGWNLVAGANLLYTTEEKDYAEFSLGFDGIGFARLLRVDVVTAFHQGKHQGFGYMVGLSLPLNELQL